MALYNGNKENKPLKEQKKHPTLPQRNALQPLQDNPSSDQTQFKVAERETQNDVFTNSTKMISGRSYSHQALRSNEIMVVAISRPPPGSIPDKDN